MRVPAVFMRGGTSNAVVFDRRHLPEDEAGRERLFIVALGSPDPYGRQLDGMEGGSSSLSKVCIVGPPSRPDADVDYTFGQVAVVRPYIDWSSNCGNMSSAIGPFAVDEGMVAAPGPEGVVVIHNTNTGKLIRSRFPVEDGRAAVEGETTIPGVPGTGAPVDLEFLDPGGAGTGTLLPTGNVLDLLEVEGAGSVPVSLVDAANPFVFVDASNVGITGTEMPAALDARPEVMERLERGSAEPGPAVVCTIVDVFAERPLSGNQLAVVRGGAHLDTVTMQAIALEMNFSETTFVVEERSDEARARIFTPVRQLPFAGHPTLGTAWVLGRDRDSYTLDLPAGRVPVTFEAGGIAWMQPPPVEPGAVLSSQSAAALLGLPRSDIDTRYPCQFATIGPRFVLIGVKALDALRRVTIQAEVYEDLAGGDVPGVFVFANDAYNHDADFAARMFHHRGFREDPATGSANAAFAAHLRSLGVRGRFVVEQGFEIGRPSRLYLDVADTIRVGGKVRPVLTGRFDY